MGPDRGLPKPAADAPGRHDPRESKTRGPRQRPQPFYNLISQGANHHLYSILCVGSESTSPAPARTRRPRSPGNHLRNSYHDFPTPSHVPSPCLSEFSTCTNAPVLHLALLVFHWLLPLNQRAGSEISRVKNKPFLHLDLWPQVSPPSPAALLENVTFLACIHFHLHSTLC